MKNIQKMAATLAVGMLVSILAFAQSTPPGPTFEVGNTYLQLTEVQQAIYLMGALDGMDLIAAMSGNAHLVKSLSACTKGMTAGQIRAIVNQHLKENPTKWDWQMPVLVYDAMIGACKQRGSPLP